MDRDFDMEDFYGDVITLRGMDNGPVSIILWGWDPLPDGQPPIRNFDSYKDAYDWAYRRGYRE
jgi:hypothetical protein